MNKIHKLVIIGLLLALVVGQLMVPGRGVVLLYCITSAALFYAIGTRKLFQEEKTINEEWDIKEKTSSFATIPLGLGIALTLIAILFQMMLWPCNSVQKYGSLACLAVGAIMAFVSPDSTPKLKRFAGIWLLIGIIFTLPQTWLLHKQIRYHAFPQYVEAVKANYDNANIETYHARRCEFAKVNFCYRDPQAYADLHALEDSLRNVCSKENDVVITAFSFNPKIKRAVPLPPK